MAQKTFKEDCLKGKVAVITGGGSGIGKACSELYMRHGCDVAILGRSKQRVDEASNELTKAVNNGTKCLPISCDVRDYKSLEVAFDEILKCYGRIDILINGAAGNFLAPVTKLSSGAFKTVLDIDTVGTFNATKLAFQKYMQKNGGSIINLSANLYGVLFQSHASSAKSGVDAMTKNLAVEWGVNNVRVNSIAIGPIQGTEGFSRLSTEKTKEWSSMVPLQRFGNVFDIANTALFLATDAANWITGTIIDVDGGAVFTYPGALYASTMMKSKL
jgi:peroxisomal 2,4-dienoyl-CoA reductase